MLQLFTDKPILPTRFSLVVSPLTQAMAHSPFNRLELEPWAESLDTSLYTGDAVRAAAAVDRSRVVR